MLCVQTVPRQLLRVRQRCCIPSQRFLHDTTSTHGRGPRIAIVGSGPAGFYTAQKAMREIPDTKIDMYEQLPTPFGLVRYGVAPDHPEVKNCQDTFEDLAASPNYTFIGNVSLGHDLPLPLLAQHYDAIVFAYGASKDRKIGLEGEDRPHIYSARAFVGWYNGLPEYRDLNPDLQAGDTAVVVGQGNVALDVARALLTHVDDLSKTDMTEYALETLSTSQIKHVHVVGRRGPLQAAFTIKEVRELLQLPDVNFEPIPSNLFPPDLKKLERPKRRIMELLQKGSPHKPSATKSWSLNFLLSPLSLNYSAHNPNVLESVTFQRNTLANPADPNSSVTPSLSDPAQPSTTTLPTTTLFRSIGYAATPIPGMSLLGASFDTRRGTIQHDGFGRAVPIGTESQLTPPSSPSSSAPSPAPTPSPQPPAIYAAGWVKRGPTGVIASTMTDAFQTAEAIIEDWRRTVTTQLPAERKGWEGVKVDARRQGLELRPVHWEGWRRIDGVERRRGEERGKPREKMGRVGDMLDAAEGGGDGGGGGGA